MANHNDDEVEKPRNVDALSPEILESELLNYSREILEGLPVGILIIDYERRIHYVNPKALEMMKASRKEEVLGKACHRFVCPVEENKCPVLDLMQKVEYSEKTLVDLYGVEHPVIKSVMPMEAAGKDFLLEVFWDIRRLKERDSEKVTKEIERLKKEFIMNISHEIRTPVNVLNGAIDLLLHNSHPEDSPKLLTMVKKSALRLVRIINDVLDISMLVTGYYEEHNSRLDIREIISFAQESAFAQNEGKEIGINIDISPDIPEPIWGDAHKLRRILANIVDNAFKFSKKGSVDISVSLHSCFPEDSKSCLLFAVKDTGAEIPPYKQKIIFDYFTQADSSTTKLYEGLGLGLSIAEKLIRGLGGNIWVESSREKTIFFFTFFVRKRSV